jgi:hypothetical protein
MFCAGLFGCSPDQEIEWLELEEAAAMVRPFSPDEKERRAKVVRVMDGETIQAVIKNGDQIESHRVRLSGSVENKSDRNEPERSDPERRNRLIAKLAEDDGYCFITLGKEDEFGRRLGAAVTRKGENLHDYLDRMAALDCALTAAGLIPPSPAPVPPLVAPSLSAPVELIVSGSKS